MKKILALTLIAALSLLALTSCNVSFYEIDDHTRYAKGGGTVTEAVDKIDVEWIAGQVDIKYHGDSTVLFYEESNRSLDDKTSMYHYFDGRTLHIKFYRHGMHVASVPEKTLTIFLPQSMMPSDIDLELVSSNLSVEGVKLASLDIECVSGDISLYDVEIGDIDVEMVSGDIKALTTGEIGSFDIEMVSGDINLEFESAPKSLDIETVSGDTLITHPESDGMTLDFESISGEVSYDLAFTKNGRLYVLGDGSSRYSIESTSGNVEIKKKQ